MAAPGPYRWNMPNDKHRLKDNFGHAANFRDREHTAYAAKVRVAQNENASHGGLKIRERACRLRHIINSSNRMDRRNLWDPWLKTDPLFVIQEARQYVDSKGLRLRPSSIRQTIAGNAGQPWSPAVLRRIRNRFQSTITTKLRQSDPYDPQHRVRHKLARWRLPDRPATNADRVLRRLQAIRTSVSPRVAAAVLRTIWNGWTTKRRFQREGSACFPGCSPNAVDCIEHYACCAIVRRAARQHLRIQLRDWPYALTDFLMATGPPSAPHPTEGYIARSAIFLYAAYSATNAARHRPPADSNGSSAMLHQAIHEAARDNPTTLQILQRMWQ